MQLPKLVFVRQRFSRFGGGELILNRTIEALAARGAAVSMIAREWEAHEGVTFHRCDPSRSPRSSRDSRFAREACTLVGKMQNVLVQSHERMACCDIYRAGDGVHAAYLSHRAKSIGPLRRFFQQISGYHRDVVKLEREMFASPRLQAVIVNSTMVADEIVQYFSYPRERIHLIPNGIDLSKFNLQAISSTRAETRAKLGIAEGRKVLVSIGSGYERKGVAQSIQALAQSKSDAMLLVVGHEKSVSYYQSLAKKAGIEKRVRFLGRQENVLPYLAASDAMILPAIYDPFPSAVLEALACGLPVVTSDTCGARDAVKSLDPALVRDALDIEGLAAAIDRALALADKPDTKARARAIAETYDMNSMIGRMLDLYGKLAAEK